MSSYTHNPKTSSSSDHIEMQNTIHNLDRTKSSGAVTISAELFEKIYLGPKTTTGANKRNQYANPTPLGLLGYVLAVCTFSTNIMGWGGADSLTGVAGIFFFTGPVLLVLATILEWVVGNFFSMMCFALFSVFWLSFGLLQLPTLGLAASYSPTGNAAEGAASMGFNATIAMYLIVWGFAMFTFFIFTLRTNVVFALIFFFAFIGVFLLSGSYWMVSLGNYERAKVLVKAGGAVLFVMGLLGWYALIVIMAAEMRMTVNLPVGDLSHFWPRSDIELADLEKNE